MIRDATGNIDSAEAREKREPIVTPDVDAPFPAEPRTMWPISARLDGRPELRITSLSPSHPHCGTAFHAALHSARRV